MWNGVSNIASSGEPSESESIGSEKAGWLGLALYGAVL